MSQLEPGEKVRMQWLALWKSCTHFRNDYTVWSNNFKDFIVRDDPSLDYTYKYDVTEWAHNDTGYGVYLK